MTSTPLTENTERFLREKLEKLETYYERIESASVFIKTEDESGMGDKTVEVRLSIPGPDVFASDTSDSFEKSVVEVAEKLRRQLRKHKDKLNTH